jgi:hypothetical protein
MMMGLVRQHPVFKGVPKLMAIGAVTSVLVANIMTYHMIKSGPESDLPLIYLLALQLVFTMTAAGLLFRGGGIRTTPWHLGLPLPAETLWRSHYLALIDAMLGVLLFQGVITGGFLKLLSMLDSKLALPVQDILLSFLSPALVLLFVAGMTASFREGLVDLSHSKRWPVFRAAILVSAMVLVFLLFYLPPVLGIIPVAGAALAAARARRRLPSSLTFGDGNGSGAGSALPASWGHLAKAPTIFRSNSPFVSMAILNQLFKVPYPWVFLFTLFIAFFGALLAGYPQYSSRTFTETLRLNNYFLTVYLMISMTGEFVLRLYKMDALPVNRRSLLRYLVMPGLLAILGGYGGARLWVEVRNIPVEQVAFQDRHGKYGAAVAPSFNQISELGSTLEATSPWGETHSSEARHFLPGLVPRRAANSPYLTDGKTSREFLAWQLSRAVEDVYGQWIDPQELFERYIQAGPDSCCWIPRGGFTVAKDYGLKPRSGGPAGAFILGPVLALYFLVLGVYFWFQGESRSVRWARTAWWIMMGSLFFLHIMQAFNFLGLLPGLNHFGIAVLVFATARRLGEMGPTGWALAYGIAFLLAYLAWRYCDRMFHRLEAPRP